MNKEERHKTAVLHLSHTDIKTDSRILKEMISICSLDDVNVFGIGIFRDIGCKVSLGADNLDIDSLKLLSRKFQIIPSLLRHCLVFVELFLKTIFCSFKIRPRVVHVHDNIMLPIGVVLKIFHNCKLIYDAHELESAKNGLSETFGKLILFTEKIMWKFIDTLIVVSPSIDKWYNGNLGKKDSVVILNSPNVAIEKEEKSYLRNYFSIPLDSMIFLYVGGLMPGRGIDLITKVFMEENINSSLVFLGYGELSEKLKKVAMGYSNIYVHDAVAHEQVVSIAKSADVGLCLIQNVSLSDYYCLPNKLFEYCFAGIPVLASDFPDISRTVEEYNLGKCSKLDIESIHDAVKEFEDMVELQTFLKEDLYDLSWNAQEKKLIRLYKKLLIEKKD